MKSLCSLGLLIGRILLSLVFISAGVGKILGFNETLQYMNAAGITTLTSLFLVGAMILELVGGFLLVIGFKTRLVAFLLFLFLIPTTFIFHHFWDVPESEKMIQSFMFFKNLAIMGGLLILASTTAGKLSVDGDTKCESK